MLQEFSVKKLFQGTLIYSGGQILSKAASFFLLPLMTANLTPADYGLLAILAALSQFLTGFFSLGFFVPISREYRLLKERLLQHSLIWTAFIFLLFYNLGLIALCFIFKQPLTHYLLGNANSYLIFISISALSFSVLSGPFNLFLRLEEKPYTALFFSLLEMALSFSFTLWLLLKMKLGIASPIYGAFISSGFCLGCYLIYGFSSLTKKTGLKKFLPDLLKQGSPYIFGFLGYFLLTSASRFVLEKMSSLEETGIFFMTQNLVKPIDLLVCGFASAWPAYLSKLGEKKAYASSVIALLLKKAFLIALAFSFPFFAFGKPVCKLMLHQAFARCGELTGILAFSQTLWGLYIISSAALILNKKNSLQVCLELLCGLLTCLFAFMLIPIFGALGGVLATLFGFATLVSSAFYYSPSHLSLYKPLIKTFFIFLIFSSLTFLPLENFWEQSLLGIFLTAAFTFIVSRALKEKPAAQFTPQALASS